MLQPQVLMNATHTGDPEVIPPPPSHAPSLPSLPVTLPVMLTKKRRAPAASRAKVKKQKVAHPPCPWIIKLWLHRPSFNVAPFAALLLTFFIFYFYPFSKKYCCIALLSCFVLPIVPVSLFLLFDQMYVRSLCLSLKWNLCVVIFSEHQHGLARGIRLGDLWRLCSIVMWTRVMACWVSPSILGEWSNVVIMFPKAEYTYKYLPPLCAAFRIHCKMDV